MLEPAIVHLTKNMPVFVHYRAVWEAASETPGKVGYVVDVPSLMGSI